MSGGAKAVLFDLDGTLHDRAETVRRYLKGHARRFELPAGYAERWTELDDLGYRRKQEVTAELVAEFGLSYAPAELFQDFTDHAWSDVAPMPHALAVLTELRRRGVRLGIVTNGWTAKQLECLRGLDFGALIDDVIVSEAVGLKKPDPAIFRLSLSRLDVSAQETWYVGDSPVNDVAGPQAVGIRAALLPGGHPLPPH
ncbi:HAD family hydrolase [Deinococcus sp. KNUC1210]|uniref:HAD family hydrolase n=1 Tax=Deinococcus sp. KNUC1210 TaxID=2917691 RepID=UPI001EF15A0B|nr:HAD family hydrolase [Deinococcus sp. KNUC1210]ULH15839.1 HAD family hydrolase [Deinococcus sp. KNUC1210]